MARAWYQALYEHFDGYDEEPYTQCTADEVDFLEVILNQRHWGTVLGIGCGTGRHALELARRGYKVTGVDLSEAMIDQGKKQAEQEGLAIHFLAGRCSSVSI
ncbi:MAG: methyltransferase domain-containing protein [Anaerolineales bacterium]|nr:methyltransferase domain-containing protein [Anaerolineales bacterium]